MKLSEHMDIVPPSRLAGFRGYEDFKRYAGSLFDLSADELAGLYQVLLKLQGIGEDPVETMTFWKEHTCQGECPDFIRFMIQVDNLDLEVLKEVA